MIGKQKKQINQKEQSNKRGITLIALVVTIVVLLILAGVSISMLTGENGIIRQAQEAKKKTEESQKDEENILGQLEEMIGGVPKVNDETPGELAGSGTDKKPYLIESIEDLVMFSEAVNGGNSFEGKVVKLNQSLDFNSENSYQNYANTELFGDYNGDGTTEGIKEEVTKITGRGFIPIGLVDNTNNNVFSGEFDGNNRNILNLYIRKENEETTTIGFFAQNLGTIKKLGLTGKIIVTSTNEVYVGGIAGENKSSIENCLTDISFELNAEGCYRRDYR